MKTIPQDLAAPTRTPEYINPWRMFTGGIVPNWLLMRTEVSSGAKLCYAILAQFAGEAGDCFPRQEKIAERMGCSVRRVREYIRELETLALIHSVQRGLSRSNTYRFRKHPWMLARERQGSPLESGKPPSAPSTADRTHSAAPDRSYPAGQERSVLTCQDRSDPAGPIGEEIQYKEIQSKEHTHTGQGSPHSPPTLEGIVAFASVQGIPEEVAQSYYLDRESVGWMKRGQPIHQWQSDIRAYLSKWRAVDFARTTRSKGSRPSSKGAFATIPAAGAYTSKKI